MITVGTEHHTQSTLAQQNMKEQLHYVLLLAVALMALGLDETTAFVSHATTHPSRQRPLATTSATTTTTTTTTTVLNAAAVANPFKRLPWNVRKEKERQARRLKQERAALHRQLGIAEDATYEEIVAATEGLIARAGSNNIKEKVKIEVAKDKILQIRLNERLAGLARENKEARAMSTYEVEGCVSCRVVSCRCVRVLL